MRSHNRFISEDMIKMNLQLQIIFSLLSNQTRQNGTKSSVWPLAIVLTDKVAGNGWEAV